VIDPCTGTIPTARAADVPTDVVFPTTAPPLGDGTVTLTWTPDLTCGAPVPVQIAPRFTT
jgi:hypothetical protein